MTQPKNLYGLTGKFKTKPGKGSEMVAILLQAAEGVKAAKGCHLYIVCQDAANPDIIWVFETWDSKEDHDNSLKLPGTPEMIAKAMPLIDGKPEGTPLIVAGGLGLSLES